MAASRPSGEAYMRFPIIAVSVSAMALATGAFAQTKPQSPPAALPGGTARHGG